MMNSHTNNKNMTAIFTEYRNDFMRGRISGANDVKIIIDIQSIRGMTFTSVVEMGRWFNSEKAREAHDELQMRQPELFVKYRSIL